LREAGAQVLGMAAIFTYGFPQADRAFEVADCSLSALSDYEHLLRQAVSIGFVKEADLRLLESWRQAPAEWGGVPPHIPNE
jgi:orotate phosphoribosyltransferase